MTIRIGRTLLLASVAFAAGALPGAPVSRVAAAEFTLETEAAYEVRPGDGEIDVVIGMAFTNTTPDPEGQFSVFPEVLVAVHDGVTAATATDAEGDLDVAVAADENDVNVATIELREGIRYEDTVELELRYTLADSDDPQLRVRPSVVVFPVWSFGTSGSVTVRLPAGYEARVDGDPLNAAADGSLVSGPIDDPTQWLALLTATRPADLVTFETTVPLTGGTADVQVRALPDDEAWGRRTLALLERALPVLEEEVGLPYPRVGAIVLTETAVGDASGFAERPGTGTEIPVAFDQPEFTALHQVAHVWLSPELAEAPWIREGLASDVAGRVAAEIGIDPPFDPAAEAERLADAAYPLDMWDPAARGPTEDFGYAASWAFVAELREAVGDDAMRAVLARVATSVGPYQNAEIEAPADNGSAPQQPLTSRSFLDQLEAVSDMDLAPRFAERVLIESDVALLEARAAARDAFDQLAAAAEPWGAPDPVRLAMREWDFDAAGDAIAEAMTWLEGRDRLLDLMAATGLSAPDRLQQEYLSSGGGAAARDELEAETAVAESYAATLADANGERSLLGRVGLIGGPDPAQRLAVANGRFADGDLRGALDAISEAQRILASAETGGIIRLLSAALVVVILVAVAILLIRRRAAYTAAR